jgi:tRNA dimethylallyltransferase
VDEVRALTESGRLPRGSTAAQAIGYKEILSYLDGECSLEAAVETLKTATRRYAKRQITWFGSKDYVTPVEVTGALSDADLEKIIKNVKKAFPFS